MVVAIDFAQPLAQGVGVVAAVADAVQELADLTPEAGAGPAEVRFQNLPDVHARGHAQRLEHDVDRGGVLQRRHVLDRHRSETGRVGQEWVRTFSYGGWP